MILDSMTVFITRFDPKKKNDFTCPPSALVNPDNLFEWFYKVYK
jgi:hypothetical protein